MATIQIIALNSASTPLGAGDLMHLRQGAEDKKISLTDLLGNLPSDVITSGTITSNDEIFATRADGNPSKVNVINSEGRGALVTDGTAVGVESDNSANTNPQSVIVGRNGGDTEVYQDGSLSATFGSSGIDVTGGGFFSNTVNIIKTGTDASVFEASNTEGGALFWTDGGYAYVGSKDSVGGNQEVVLRGDNGGDTTIYQNGNLAATFDGGGLDIVGGATLTNGISITNISALSISLTRTGGNEATAILSTGGNEGSLSLSSLGNATYKIAASLDNLTIDREDVKIININSTGLDVTGELSTTGQLTVNSNIMDLHYTSTGAARIFARNDDNGLELRADAGVGQIRTTDGSTTAGNVHVQCAESSGTTSLFGNNSEQLRADNGFVSVNNQIRNSNSPVSNNDLTRKAYVDNKTASSVSGDFGEVSVGVVKIKWGQKSTINGNVTVDFTDEGLNNFSNANFAVSLVAETSSANDANIAFHSPTSTGFQIRNTRVDSVKWICIGN